MFLWHKIFNRSKKHFLLASVILFQHLNPSLSMLILYHIFAFLSSTTKGSEPKLRTFCTMTDYSTFDTFESSSQAKRQDVDGSSEKCGIGEKLVSAALFGTRTCAFKAFLCSDLCEFEPAASCSAWAVLGLFFGKKCTGQNCGQKDTPRKRCYASLWGVIVCRILTWGIRFVKLIFIVVRSVFKAINL